MPKVLDVRMPRAESFGTKAVQPRKVGAQGTKEDETEVEGH